MREGVLLVDEDGRVALVNPALREMLLVGDDAVGRLPIEVVRDAALHGLLEQARRGRGASAEGEIVVGGIKPRRLLVRAERLRTAPGGLFVVFYDVTDLRRLESLRRDFVANASHELRTPVTSIRSAAETLASIPPGDRDASARFVGIVSRNAERLQQLVEDLLDLSRIEARELELASLPIDLTAVVDRVVALLSERAARAGSKLVVTLGAPAPSPRGDARALEQILVNLLDNAVKYCPGATVRVEARKEGDRVCIDVRDAGPGIAEQHLERLFERFYRVDPGRSRQLGGTGLGLAIVKHLAEAMDGVVSVRSELGEGTTFTVELPTAELPIAELSTPEPGEVVRG
jgi:two-component system phosphate regulon sensor histidine kinase PhoR